MAPFLLYVELAKMLQSCAECSLTDVNVVQTSFYCPIYEVAPAAKKMLHTYFWELGSSIRSRNVWCLLNF